MVRVQGLRCRVWGLGSACATARVATCSSAREVRGLTSQHSRGYVLHEYPPGQITEGLCYMTEGVCYMKTPPGITEGVCYINTPGGPWRTRWTVTTLGGVEPHAFSTEREGNNLFCLKRGQAKVRSWP